jgi:exosortase/archaeosortase family protein
LTPWETWEYSAASERHELAELLKKWNDGGVVWQSDPFSQAEVQKVRARITTLENRDRGPTVTFVLREGLSSKLTEARQALMQAQTDKGLNETDRGAKVEEAKARMADLESKKKSAAEADPKSIEDLSFSFVVVPDCGAIPTMVIFLAAVLAFPTQWWRKLLGMLVGVPALFFINTLRLTVLAVIGAWNHGGPIFKFAQEYVWQGIYIIFVVVVWLVWVELLVKRKNA